MHADEIARKIERAHEKLLKAKARLQKLQVRLAQSRGTLPAHPRARNDDRRAQWLRFVALAALGWTGIPLLKLFEQDKKPVSAPAQTQPPPAPTPTNTLASFWTFGRRAR